MTGAASGIGKAIADAFAAHGSRVVLLDRSDIVRDVARKPGADHTGLVVDITSEDEVVASRRLITATVGPIDVLAKDWRTLLHESDADAGCGRPDMVSPPERSVQAQ